ncbi:unnamed protein product [Vitrella brassicaformis CCMP3155]|uniref:Uncharacterized protein n=2 Tax=Vitrella brassicaformis TaxID=1169539 RepID=A0A0G4FB98_VITBC|nr:unnamed protein product [Vitrella brassicaformis CCMP3155]|eukprot:CEM10160.1 unnamed protein product [Vitrella brassicaformis CCMP3155]
MLRQEEEVTVDDLIQDDHVDAGEENEFDEKWEEAIAKHQQGNQREQASRPQTASRNRSRPGTTSSSHDGGDQDAAAAAIRSQTDASWRRPPSLTEDTVLKATTGQEEAFAFTPTSGMGLALPSSPGHSTSQPESPGTIPLPPSHSPTFDPSKKPRSILSPAGGAKASEWPDEHLRKSHSSVRIQEESPTSAASPTRIDDAHSAQWGAGHSAFFSSMGSQAFGQSDSFSSGGGRVGLGLRPHTAMGRSEGEGHGPRISKKYIRERKARQREVDKEMDALVERGRLEVIYDALHKMGEANEWANALGMKESYRAYKDELGALTCHIYEGNGFKREVSLQIFVTHEYPRLRSRYFTFRGRKGTRQRHTASTADLQTPDFKKKRQEELQSALLTTVQLTNILKEQLKILDRSADSFSPYVIE